VLQACKRLRESFDEDEHDDEPPHHKNVLTGVGT
jgi:hypothetical protein